MINLLDFTYDELEEYIVGLGEPKFRTKQIYEKLVSGIGNFDEITNIPKELRKFLNENADTGKLEIADKLISKIDGTIKFLYRLKDGNVIECVVMEYKHGTTICISTQVGCKMGCVFCASGDLGFIRNLTSGEMLSQVITSNKGINKKISNVVLMGIGEPLDNYDHVMKFLKSANDPKGLNIGGRHFTLSTAGIIPKIKDLINERLQLTLSISLHAAFDDKRSLLMPLNKKYSIDNLMEICKIYTNEIKRRITFEYAVIAGVNDSAQDAERLSSLIKGMLCHVNLIPINKVKDKGYSRSTTEVVNKFKSTLERHGIEATVRREMGSDIDAACGQLRRALINASHKSFDTN